MIDLPKLETEHSKIQGIRNYNSGYRDATPSVWNDIELIKYTFDGQTITFTKVLRNSGSQIPIMMVTAKDRQEDIRNGFLTGTDDYMVKPIDEVEMLLRIQALLRRANIAKDHEIVVGNTTLLYDSFIVREGDTEYELPRKEFQLLFKFLSYPNKTFTRKQLMEEFWNYESQSDERTVDVHINRLRERFKNNSDFEIVTVRGLGYKAVKKD